MKIKIFLVLLSLISLISAAENCDKCFKRRVALYDCNVQVARPDDAAAIIAWWKLFRPAEIARSTIHNSNNPGNDCLQWLDGAMINAAELQGDVLKSGQEYANLPPAGPIESCEYLLGSIVTETDGKFRCPFQPYGCSLPSSVTVRSKVRTRLTGSRLAT